MFVQEEKIFAGKVLKIHICTMDGAEWLEEITEDTTVEKLKEKCLKHVSYGLFVSALLLFLSCHSCCWSDDMRCVCELSVSVSTCFVFIVSGETLLFIG